MKIDYYDNTRLVISNSKERYTFLNLYKLGYDLNIKEDYWRLYEYSTKVRDINNLNLFVSTTFNHTGTNHELTFGYDINHLSRRTLEFNKEGNLEKDYILIFNPFNTHDIKQYETFLPPNIPIDDYLELQEGNKRRYTNKYTKESFENIQYPDSIIEDFFYKDNYYSNILNTFSNNSNKIKEIVNNIEDELYMTSLSYQLKKRL